MNTISLIAKGENTRNALLGQLNTLLGDKVKIKGYCLDDIKDNTIENNSDLIIMSSKAVYQHVNKFFRNNQKILIARRSINYQYIDKLLDLPKDMDVLLVNDMFSSTHETIALLKELGINHINFYPYYPNIKKYPKLKTAVTPEENQLVPKCVEKIIDIKTRIIDFTTLIEILIKLNIFDEKVNLLSARYLKDIIELLKKNKHMADIYKYLQNQLHTIIDSVHDGIIAFDENKKLTVINPVAKKIFKIKESDLLYKNIEESSKGEVIVKSLNKLKDNQILKTGQHYVVVNKVDIKNNKEIKGILYILKDVTKIQELEKQLRRRLYSSKYIANYTFDDIIGVSESINKTKQLAKKVASSNSPVLIEGETGTGKELFAQAIHNISHRKNGPFVAVNFAALPETLIESELFGYEEGAFTGAKRGGKPGLFEQAHGGTIFLDEIGDAPIYCQISILRVLQEKQVRRVSGDKVLPIDVRVISATNKNLKTLVAKEKFRKDLYYRLNVFPIKIPPLRERKKDVIVLAKVFYKNFFHNQPMIPPKIYFKKIKNNLLNYSWPGNIRELRNIVELLVNIRPDKVPSVEDLPEEFKITNYIKFAKTFKNLTTLEKKIITEIFRAKQKNESTGRRTLAKKFRVSEYKIRKIAHNLESKGIVIICRGRKGMKLSRLGYSIAMKLHERTNKMV